MDNENKNISTRKIVLIPEYSDTKKWIKKVNDFAISDYKHKIEVKEEQIKNIKKKKLNKEDETRLLEKYQKQLDTLNDKLNTYIETKEITKEIVNNYTYNLVRESMESEVRRKNYILSWAFSKMIENGVQYMDIKDRTKFIKDMMNTAYRVKGSKKGSAFDDVEISNILNGYGIAFSKDFTKKLIKDVNDGLLDGKISQRTYKMDSPFTIAKSTMGFSHDYDSYEELCEHINDKDCNMYFDFGGNQKPTIARFKIHTGYKKNKQELNATLLKIYSGEYKYCGSKIELDKTGKKIILDLSFEIPTKEVFLDENRTCGIDRGIKIPAVCALNDDKYTRGYYGYCDDLFAKRTKIQNQRKRLQKSLTYTSGGHGRDKKLKALKRLEEYEKNFVENYLHHISKQCVDFAVKNHCKYINIENLKGYDADDKILRNWSYYKLEQYITYKAERYGIIVRKINPCFTSQVCSFCGSYEKGQRKTQSDFLCANENCTSHSEKHKYINADFNAARNIAMSTLYYDGEITNKQIEEAANYYGIVLDENKDKELVA